jgi:lipopolysaccharide export system protein LptC
VISRFYRWLYHHRQQRASRQRLSGRTRSRPRFHRFSYTVFTREGSSKYAPGELRKHWLRVLLSLAAIAGIGWFLWESAHALFLFQP